LWFAICEGAKFILRCLKPSGQGKTFVVFGHTSIVVPSSGNNRQFDPHMPVL
jgi:hypothetical protein